MEDAALDESELPDADEVDDTSEEDDSLDEDGEDSEEETEDSEVEEVWEKSEENEESDASEDCEDDEESEDDDSLDDESGMLSCDEDEDSGDEVVDVEEVWEVEEVSEDDACGMEIDPGVPKISGPGSNPMDSVAVRQLEARVPGAARSMRSMLALVPPEGLAPAKGLPVPSSTSSRTMPDASRRRRSNLVLGRLMAEVWIHGSSARREEAAVKLPTMPTSPAAMTDPSANTMIVPSSPVLLRLVSHQPERSQSAVPVQAISTHSSDAERSDPIHSTSLMTAAPSVPASTAHVPSPDSVQRSTLAGRT